MKELKIEKVLEKVEFEDQHSMLVRVETGGFGIVAKLKGAIKVVFTHDFSLAIKIYVRCSQEVIGGPGLAYYN